MPTYEFVCKKCRHLFEIHESVAQHDLHKEKCPKCGSKQLQQQFSGIQVKTSRKY